MHICFLVTTLIKKGIIQLSLFEDEIIEVEGEDNVRYILRRNKVRAGELVQNREARIERLAEYVRIKNKYLKEHPRAKIDVARRNINEETIKLKLSSIVTVELNERKLKLNIDEVEKKKQGELDGCYVVKTEAAKDVLDTKTAHDRYKDLSLVEYAFRTMKTTIEELRPVFVRKEGRTRGHVFVVMLAYMITKYISDRVFSLGYTRKFAIESLDKIQYIEYNFKGAKIKVSPKNLHKHQNEILEAIGVKLNVAKKK